MISKTSFLLTVCIVLVSSGLCAEEYKMKHDCQAMMARKHQMMADMQAMDKVLDEKASRMNAATGEERLAAAIDVINELVSQRKIMREKMTRLNEHEMRHMCEHMSEGMTDKPGKSMMDCPMIKEWKKPAPDQ